MTDYGVSAQGFLRKPLPVILDDLAARQRSDIDPNWNTEADSLAGQYNGIVADALAQLWEALEAVYASGDRAQAEDAALDAIGDLTGTPRRTATKSTVILTLSFDGATTVPAGSVVSVDGDPAARFVTLADVIAGGITYPVSVDVAAEAETAGPVAAQATKLTVIETAVTHWTAVNNVTAATVGKLRAGNAEYVATQLRELQSQGGGTVEGLRADLEKLSGVDAALVLENYSALTVDGVPSHAFEAIVRTTVGSDDATLNAAITASIWKNKPAGILAYGVTTVVVTDTQGIDHDVSFSRPTVRRVYTAVRLTPAPGYTVGGLTDAVQAAIVNVTLLLADLTRGPGFLGIGTDVYASRLLCAVVDVPGVIDAALGISFSAIATPELGVSSLAIGPREVANLAVDPADIVVSA